MKTEIRGSVVPLITPFRDDLSIDFECLARLIDWHVREGTHCISVAGTTGEPSSLSIEEREKLFEKAIECVDGRVPFVAGTGTNNLEDTLRLTRKAEGLGADAALVIAPYYVKPSQEGLFRYFSKIASSVSIRIILYNIPGRAAVNIEPETVGRLAEEYGNVYGIKESIRDLDHVTAVLSLCGRDFKVYSGIESLCFPMLAIGGAGHFSATANILPREVAGIYDLTVAGRWSEAADMHFRLFPFNDAVFWETNPVPIKAAMSIMGLSGASVRPPLSSLSDENMQRMRKLLSEHLPASTGAGK